MDSDREALAQQLQKSSEAETPRQQVNNVVGTSQFQNNREVYAFCNITQLREVKDGQESSSPNRSRLEDLDTIDCTDLKEYYSNTFCKASPLSWCDWYTWDIDHVYTELDLQDSATSKLGVEGLFEQWHKHKPKGGSSRILIEGDAGYGKSTLMLKIASDWSETNSDSKAYTSPFSLLFVVKLGSVGEDGEILSYMEKFYKEHMDTPLKNVLKSKSADKVLILLDGYDEAKAKTKEEVDRIMKKETMSKCHVVLTSRCGHVPGDVKGIALPVRVKGFGERQVAVAVGKFFIMAGHLTKAEVKSCIDKPVPPSIDDFERVQEKYPLLPEDQPLSLEQFNEFMGKLRTESPYKELALCPLLCVMMCCLVSECPNGKLPSTVPGLYFAMINRNLYRAERKKAPGKYWDLSILQDRITKGHEGYLQDFGRLCINGLKTRSMSFTLFEITGNEKAETTDVEVTQLVAAGVLVRDTSARIPRYQVPHQTTAEFLAAYCLETDSSEADKTFCQQNLLALYREHASFYEVAASLIEMGKTRCLAHAFSGIKFPDDCLTKMPFMKSYFNQHFAAGTWLEFKEALPNQLKITIKSADVTVSSTEPSLTLLQLCEGLDNGNTSETNACPSFSKDCSVSMKGDLNPELLQTLLESGVGLDRLDLNGEFKTNKSVGGKYTAVSEVARVLQELLKSDSCPVQLSLSFITEGLLPAVTEAMKEVPEGCRLQSFHFNLDWPDNAQSLEELAEGDQLLEELAGNWLSHLQHLGFENWNFSSRFLPIFKRLREPGCRLTSLHLTKYALHLEDLIMLASKLETLSLKWVKLVFDVTEISKYAAKERCSLKSLQLFGVYLSLKGSLPSADENQELLLGWRNVALNLEELAIDHCKFPIELFSWLNLSLPKLRTVTIDLIEGTTPNGDDQFYANQVLEALIRSSGESIEELSLLQDFWEIQDILKLHPIREALQRCPRIKSVNIDHRVYNYKASIGPGHSTPLSPSDKEALKSDNLYSALFKIVLSVPKLQNLTCELFFHIRDQIGTFHAIADKAEKWKGTTNDNGCKTSLTLHGLSNWYASKAIHVFRERGLEYRLRYVSDKTYEFWFPPRV